MNTTITWTRPLLERFKADYEAAHRDLRVSFVFEGSEFIVSYAKYLIQYLEGRLR